MRTTPPRRNRVTPAGEILAIELRGAWTGNRGILHRDDGTGARIVRSHAALAWITCRLRFGDRRIPQWAPGHYTPLFFHDEAVALAAGHRPCAECRRPAFRAHLTAIAARGATGPAGATGPPDPAGLDAAPPSRAPDLDRLLDRQRRFPRTSRRRWHDRLWSGLPDGSFVGTADGTALVLGDALVGWTPAGYGRARRRPARGTARVLTPPVTIAALAAGYPVQIDGAARHAAGQTVSEAGASTEGSSSATDR